MKQLVLIYLIFMISCNQNKGTNNNNVQKPEKGNYAAELIDNGFLKYADS